MTSKSLTRVRTILLGFLTLACLAAVAAGGGTLQGPVASAVPFDFDTAPGRLPKNVVPESYTISITPDVPARTFAGTEAVSLRFRTATARVIFNSLNLKLRDVRLDGVPVRQVLTDDGAQLTTLTLPAAAPAGLHTLTLSYTGLIQSAPQGLFAQPYDNDDGTRGIMLATQMEPADARRLFPCWDEPAFRATYALTAVLPAQWTAVSNMPVAKRLVQGRLAATSFQPSPRMPSYLLDLSAGDLREVSGEQDGVRLGVWAVRGREADGERALDNAKDILADYDEYFDYKYPLPKLDSIAIPGGFSGGMENWGAITYTEQALLLGESSSFDDVQNVFSLQAHEMAHQWNGDLVTMGWWDDLWLNESFASWLSAKETDRRHPSWMWLAAQDGDKEEAMRADSRASAQPVQQHVTDEVQAGAAFDQEITYRKGQAVLLMLEAYLGPAVFRDGIRDYIKARAFGNATTADLWKALSGRSHQDVAALAADWIEQPGFPLVSVAASCDPAGRRTISLTQQRFLAAVEAGSPVAQGPVWHVPLQVRSGLTAAPQTVLLTHNGQRLPAGTCQEPLSVNAEAMGYFRTQYDAATLALNTRAVSDLPDADRTVLLDDQWALVEAGRAPLASYLALAAGMGGGGDGRVWGQLAGALGTIEYAERGLPGHEAFLVYARSVIRPVWSIHGGLTGLFGVLGGWGDAAVIAEARRRFALFLHDPGAIAADDQLMILALVCRYADEVTFEQVHALATQARTDPERQRFFTALAMVRDPKLAQRVARIAISEEIPTEDLLLRFGMVSTLREEHPALAWNVFSSHADLLLSPNGAFAALTLTQEVPELFWNSLPPEQMEAWLTAHVPAQMAPNIEHGMEAVRLKLLEKARLVAAADAYLKGLRN
jgi:hypothetical protein